MIYFLTERNKNTVVVQNIKTDGHSCRHKNTISFSFMLFSISINVLYYIYNCIVIQVTRALPRYNLYGQYNSGGKYILLLLGVIPFSGMWCLIFYGY